MAIVPIAITDSEPLPVAWSTPPTISQINSAIPLGLVIFNGKAAIALKGSGDETNLSLTLTMPQGFSFLMRNCMLAVRADDLVLEFELFGEGLYTRVLPKTDDPARFNMVCPGKISQSAAKAIQIYSPAPLTPKLPLRPNDTVVFRLADMDAGATSAGDLFHHVEFYVFAIDQVDRWMVNAPAPVISHTTF